MTRQLWLLAFVALMQLPLAFYDIGTPFKFGPPGVASAQNLSNNCLNNACINDPCALYPHQLAIMPTAGASPTQLLITGSANGLRTYICGYQLTLSGSSPTALLSMGQASNGGASPTPCATGSVAANIYGYKGTMTQFGGIGAGSLAGAGASFIESPGDGKSVVLGPFPASAPSSQASVGTTWDLCVQNCTGTTACGASNVQGSFEYVQAP